MWVSFFGRGLGWGSVAALLDCAEVCLGTGCMSFGWFWRFGVWGSLMLLAWLTLEWDRAGVLVVSGFVCDVIDGMCCKGLGCCAETCLTGESRLLPERYFLLEAGESSVFGCDGRGESGGYNYACSPTRC